MLDADFYNAYFFRLDCYSLVIWLPEPPSFGDYHAILPRHEYHLYQYR